MIFKLLAVPLKMILVEHVMLLMEFAPGIIWLCVTVNGETMG